MIVNPLLCQHLRARLYSSIIPQYRQIYRIKKNCNERKNFYPTGKNILNEIGFFFKKIFIKIVDPVCRYNRHKRYDCHDVMLFQTATTNNRTYDKIIAKYKRT